MVRSISGRGQRAAFVPAGRCAEVCRLLGSKGVEYPKRFFARDYAGNRLEFSV